MVRVGLVGAGFMGYTHSLCYGMIEKARVVGVADVRGEMAERVARERSCPRYGSLRTMLAEIGSEIDAVDVCLPTYLHADAAVEALSAGKHVIVEKPLALSKADGERIVEAARSAGRQCMVAHVLRFWPEYVWLREVVERGDLGALLNMSMWRLTQRRKPGTSWQDWLYDPARCGSPAMDLHIHDLDFARALLGEPVSFAARGTVHGNRLEHLFAQYTFPGGKVVSIESGWGFPLNYPFEMGFRCAFERGAIEFRSRSGAPMLYRSDGSSEQVRVPSPAISDRATVGNVASIMGYFAELAYFVERLDAGARVEEADASDALRSLEVMLDVVASL